MPTTKEFNGTYQLSCKSMLLKVEVTKNLIVKCPPPVAQFKGQSVLDLAEWMRGQGGEFRMVPLAKDAKPTLVKPAIPKGPKPGALKTFRLRSENCEACPLIQGNSADATCIHIYRCPNCLKRYDLQAIYNEWECYSDPDPKHRGNEGLTWICPSCDKPCKQYESFIVCPHDQPIE